MSVCGVDFGCLYASVAQAERGGVTVLLNENSMRLNANAVSIQGKQRFLGDKAQAIARSNYKNTAKNLKRFIGRTLSDVQSEIAWCPGVTFCEVDGRVGVEVMYDSAPVKLSLPHLAGMMLFKLSQISAMSNKGVGIAEMVVSVPAFFDEAQRLAMLDACSISGFRCLRLINDTTATALEYGIWRSMQKMFDEGAQRIMFIDLGYSSYQVSIVEYVKGKLAVKSTTWDELLGGRDFDLAIANYIDQQFQAKYKKSCMGNVKAKMKLFDAAEKAKKTLSPKGVLKASIFVECLMDDIDFAVELSLEKFEELIAPLLARLTAPVKRALEECDMAASSLHSVEIVGGGSRVSAVKRVLSVELGLDAAAMNYGLKTTLNADECVSKGCALMAAILSPRFKVKDYEVVDSAPYSLKLAWDAAASTSMIEDDEEPESKEGDVDASDASSLTIFQRGADYPATKRITFRRDKTFELKSSYCEDSSTSTSSETTIGNFNVEVPAETAMSKVRVHVELSGHGLLTVKHAQLVTEVAEEEEEKEASSEEKKGDDMEVEKTEEGKEEEKPKKKKYKKTPLTVSSTISSMSKAQIDSTVELEAQMANTDRMLVETADKQNELEAFIYKMRDEVVGDLRPYCSDSEKATFEAALEEAEDWLYNGDGYDTTKSNYSKKLESLEALSHPIQFRFSEAEKRPAVVAQLDTKLATLASWAATPPDHIDSADVKTVAKEAADAKNWLADLMAKQKATAITVEPVITCSMCHAKMDDLDKKCKSIVNKKAPKPTPPPAAAPAPAPAEPAAESKADETKAEEKTAEEKTAEAPSDAKDEEMPDASPQHKD